MPAATLQNISLLIINLLLVLSLAWSWQLSEQQGQIERSHSILALRIQTVEDEEIPPKIVLYRLDLLDAAVALLTAHISKLLDEIRADTHEHSSTWEGSPP